MTTKVKPVVSKDLFETVKKLEESLYVEVRNGKVTKQHISQLALTTYDNVKKVQSDVIDLQRDITEIKATVQVLNDFNKIHIIFKKYKIYWFGLALILLYFGLDWKTLITKYLLTYPF